ncbi:zinc transporter ZTP29-like [Chenopodium quinoa]|uniref:zinc transporter ZTP29-like n=1 Tax=Chenopodium quinoa TaxID=63459 RepID=UPI000B77BAA8|nr:zinc transporter ZTP29-like [Chenopodium quinoa]
MPFLVIACSCATNYVSAVMRYYFSFRITLFSLLMHSSKWQAFKIASLSGLAEPLGVILVAYLFPNSLNPEILDGLLGSVGGVMAFLTLQEMLPLAFDYAGQKQAVKAVFFGMAFMSAKCMAS